MPLTITDAEDAFLSGQADFKKWEAEFTAQWYQPLMITMLGALWARMSPEEHAALRAINPQAHDEVEKMIGGQDASTQQPAW